MYRDPHDIHAETLHCDQCGVVVDTDAAAVWPPPPDRAAECCIECGGIWPRREEP
jgi:hypothetical protein